LGETPFRLLSPGAQKSSPALPHWAGELFSSVPRTSWPSGRTFLTQAIPRHRAADSVSRRIKSALAARPGSVLKLAECRIRVDFFAEQGDFPQES